MSLSLSLYIFHCSYPHRYTYLNFYLYAVRKWRKTLDPSICVTTLKCSPQFGREARLIVLFICYVACTFSKKVSSTTLHKQLVRCQAAAGKKDSTYRATIRSDNVSCARAIQKIERGTETSPTK